MNKLSFFVILLLTIALIGSIWYFKKELQEATHPVIKKEIKIIESVISTNKILLEVTRKEHDKILKERNASISNIKKMSRADLLLYISTNN